MSPVDGDGTGDGAPAARRSVFDRLPSARWVVRAFLFGQVLVAVAVMLENGWSLARIAGGGQIMTVPTAPVSPGDQRRPFTPASIPARLDPATRVDGPIRLPERLPRTLQFSLHETAEFGRVLLVYGQLDDGAASRLVGHVDSMAVPPDQVALHSPGGSVREALRIGRMLRKRKLATLILPNAACLSACPYMLAGGTERTVSKSGWVGLHQHYYDTSTILPMFMAVEGVQDGQGETLKFLDEMGIDPLIMVHSLKTPPDDIYLLVPKELEEYRLATRLIP